MTPSKHILLADNDPEIRHPISVVLKRAGYEVDQAENGLVALEKLLHAQGNEHPYDLVMTEVFNSGVTGLELIDEIQRRGFTLPILVVTGYRDNRLNRELSFRGCRHFLDKPFSLDQLLQMVEEVINSVSTRGKE